MPLEQQTTSVEVSQKMKTLGFKQESYFVWTPVFTKGNYAVIAAHETLGCADNEVSAYTVAELGSICKEKLVVTYENGKWWWQEPTYRASNSAETQADAYALGAIYLAENGLIDPKNI